MERINEILNFIDNSQQETEQQETEQQEIEQQETEQQKPEQQKPEQNQQEPEQQEPKQQPNKSLFSEQVNNNNNLYDGDNKKYNKTKRDINKILTKGTFPAVINGEVFNNSSELQIYKQNLLTSYREYNKKKTKENLKEFTAKHPPEELEELDKEKILMDDEIIYSQGKIIGFVCDGKHYKIPTTNKKKTKEIISNLKPEAKKELLTTEDPEKFINITKNNIKSPQLQQDIELHRDINKLQRDNTWNREVYYNLMLREMEQQKQKYNLPSNRPLPQAVQFGVNPRLFNKGLI